MKKVYIAILAFFISNQIIAQSASITIDASKPGVDISKNFYGIFFEEINHAGEGGIYAELIKNRGFEENRMPEDMTREGDLLHTKQGWIHYYKQPDSLSGWKLSLSGNALATAKQVNVNPLNSNTPMSMQVDIKTTEKGEVSIINEGFWGISVIKDDKYNLSLYCRSANNFKGEIEVSLQSASGQVIAQQKVNNISGDWKKYSVQFISNTTDPKALLVIKPLSAGTLWLDIVSMFPAKTYKNRENGMRNDLSTLIEQFKPGFIRFPGGCIVEGATLANRVQWKKTIGDIANRPGHWILWDYHATDGLGFHEYLQFCEDLGTPGMYVIPIGMSCQFRKREIVDTAELTPYIQDILDALEYALGPQTSKWGAERVKNGHPAPFNIKYIEIGNENYTPEYQVRYNYFYRAIKAKYPQLLTITCTDPGMREPFKATDLKYITEPIEIIDEHFYESPDFFFKSAYRYDSYDRKGPKIYVGEYAVKKWDNSLKGNLDAALAEGAFMTGLERNADIVILSSQAPSFVNDNDHTWNPDLLVYNSSSSYGTPSYQVQKLFSNNIPDKLLPVQVQNSGFSINTPEKGKGMIGFANPNDKCFYKDVKVTLDNKEFQLSELFTPESLQKLTNDGWLVGKNDYLELKMKPEIYKYGETTGWNNYKLELKAKAEEIDDIEGLTVLFYTTGPNKHYKWNIGRWLRYYWLQWYDNGYESYFGQANGKIETNHWYDISILVKNDSIFCSLDGKQIHAVKFPQLATPGVYASSGINSNGDIVLKMVNPSDLDKQIPININGINKVYKSVHAEVIAGGRYDENTFAEPLKISPKASDMAIPGNSFNYTISARSVTVLTIKQ